MNAGNFAIGCAFIAIGAASFGLVTKASNEAEDETTEKYARLGGGLMMLAGIVFMVISLVGGS